jgi:hypothetical protein
MAIRIAILGKDPLLKIMYHRALNPKSKIRNSKLNCNLPGLDTLFIV